MIPGIIETNLTVTSRIGTLITGDGTAHVKGAWTELIASTGGDAEEVLVAIAEVGVSTVDTSMLVDIGIGAAAAETVLIPDINCGAAGATDRPGQNKVFRIAVASGSRLSARLQGVVLSDTARVAIWLSRSVQHLAGGSAVEAVGEDTTTSRGTSVTPGNGAWGAWTSIGTISADRNVFMPSVDPLGDTAITGNGSHQLIQIGFGASAPDAGGTAINATWRINGNSGEMMDGIFPTSAVYADLASGQTLWARMASGTEVDARGVIIHAVECPAAVAGGGVMTGRGIRVGSAH